MTTAVKATFVFFQAEDGIRDIGVTGVQTCALPISPWRHRPGPLARHGGVRGQSDALGSERAVGGHVGRLFGTDGVRGTANRRPEERRVGKEGRSRWQPNHYKNIKADMRT